MSEDIPLSKYDKRGTKHATRRQNSMSEKAASRLVSSPDLVSWKGQARVERGVRGAPRRLPATREGSGGEANGRDGGESHYEETTSAMKGRVPEVASWRVYPGDPLTVVHETSRQGLLLLIHGGASSLGRPTRGGSQPSKPGVQEIEGCRRSGGRPPCFQRPPAGATTRRA